MLLRPCTTEAPSFCILNLPHDSTTNPHKVPLIIDMVHKKAAQMLLMADKDYFGCRKYFSCCHLWENPQCATSSCHKTEVITTIVDARRSLILFRLSIRRWCAEQLTSETHVILLLPRIMNSFMYLNSLFLYAAKAQMIFACVKVSTHQGIKAFQGMKDGALTC